MLITSLEELTLHQEVFTEVVELITVDQSISVPFGKVVQNTDDLLNILSEFSTSKEYKAGSYLYEDFKAQTKNYTLTFGQKSYLKGSLVCEPDWVYEIKVENTKEVKKVKLLKAEAKEKENIEKWERYIDNHSITDIFGLIKSHKIKFPKLEE